jgi:hypothetical protein
MLGLGSRVWWRSSRDQVHLGISSQTASRGSTSYTSVGPDLRLHFPGVTFISEIVKSLGDGTQPWSAHFEPEFEFFKQSVICYVFGDYLEDPFNKTGASISDPIKKWEYGTGVNWLPTSFTRLRLGIAYNDYVGSTAVPSGRDRDYWMGDLSAGVAF